MIHSSNSISLTATALRAHSGERQDAEATGTSLVVNLDIDNMNQVRCLETMIEGAVYTVQHLGSVLKVGMVGLSWFVCRLVVCLFVCLFVCLDNLSIKETLTRGYGHHVGNSQALSYKQ